MKHLLLSAFIAMIFGGHLFAQKQVFSVKDDFKKVTKGALQVNADTAYIMSVQRAKTINEYIAELNSLKVRYNSLIGEHEQLSANLKDVDKLLSKFSDKLKDNNSNIGTNLDQIIKDLNTTLESLKQNNNTLKQNNTKLQERLSELDKNVTLLKEETKKLRQKIWRERIVAFVTGAGCGILLTVLL